MASMLWRIHVVHCIQGTRHVPAMNIIVWLTTLFFGERRVKMECIMSGVAVLHVLIFTSEMDFALGAAR